MTFLVIGYANCPQSFSFNTRKKLGRWFTVWWFATFFHFFRHMLECHFRVPGLSDILDAF